MDDKLIKLDSDAFKTGVKSVAPQDPLMSAIAANLDGDLDVYTSGKDGDTTPEPKRKKRHYHTIFISDTHLGTRTARADLLLDFLKSVSCENLYLVGDIVDGWRLKKAWYWDTTHNDVIRRVLKMARSGTKVTYIPGNHDEAFRGFVGNNLAGVAMKMDDIYEGKNGKKYWVIHGDEFDGVVLHAKWLAHVGDWAYQALIRVNMLFNWFRRKMGYSYWSLSSYLKQRVKNAVEFIGRFEEAVAQEANRRGVQGVICGHIHKAEQRMIGDIEYKNDGDWVESCTALVETESGDWHIIEYAEEFAAREMAKLDELNKQKKKKKKAKRESVGKIAAE